MTTGPAPAPDEAGSSSRRRAVRVILGVALVAVGGWLLLCYQLFYSPSPAPVGSADAVVVLAGAAAERLEVGEHLVDDGAADELVLSTTGLPGNAATDELCGTDAAELTCFRPDPLTTRGEARAIAALARERGWDSVIVVTSSYHVRRAAVDLSQCSRTTVAMVASEPDLGPVQWLGRFVEESVALTASFVRPACARAV